MCPFEFHFVQQASLPRVCEHVEPVMWKDRAAPSGLPFVIRSQEIDRRQLRRLTVAQHFVHQDKAGAEIAELFAKCQFRKQVASVVCEAVMGRGRFAIQAQAEKREPVLFGGDLCEARVKRPGVFILIAGGSISTFPSAVFELEEPLEYRLELARFDSLD